MTQRFVPNQKVIVQEAHNQFMPNEEYTVGVTNRINGYNHCVLKDHDGVIVGACLESKLKEKRKK